MRRPHLLWMLVLTGISLTRCADHTVSPPAEKSMYALRDHVPLRAGLKDLPNDLRYGDKIQVFGCNGLTCSVRLRDTIATVSMSQLSDQQPPMGVKFVRKHSGTLQPNQQVLIQGYSPEGNLFEVDGVWVDSSSLADRPETAAETKAREKAESIAKVEEAKWQREKAKLTRERLRTEAIESERERRAFARQLRDNYLASGSDVKVSVAGAHAQELTLEYPLINGVWLYQFEHNGEVINALRSKGFTRLYLSDGWNYAKGLRLD